MKQEKRDRRSRAIVDAARKIFLKQGYRATSLEDIASMAGVGKATIYSYFPGKDALLGMVLEWSYEEYLEKVRRSMTALDDPREKLLAYARVFYEFKFAMLKDSMDRMARDDAELKNHLMGHLARLVPRELAFLEKIIHEGICAGVFRPVNTRKAASIFFNSCREMIAEIKNEYMTHGINNKLAAGVDESVSELIDILFHGILAADRKGAN